MGTWRLHNTANARRFLSELGYYTAPILAGTSTVSTDGEFSPQNMGLMRAGYAPKASVLVRDRDTGKYSIKVVTLEIHHNRGGRGTQGFDEPIDLREVWPWEHEQLDPSRHPGYDFISFYSVHSK